MEGESFYTHAPLEPRAFTFFTPHDSNQSRADTRARRIPSSDLVFIHKICRLLFRAECHCYKMRRRRRRNTVLVSKPFWVFFHRKFEKNFHFSVSSVFKNLRLEEKKKDKKLASQNYLRYNQNDRCFSTPWRDKKKKKNMYRLECETRQFLYSP